MVKPNRGEENDKLLNSFSFRMGEELVTLLEQGNFFQNDYIVHVC